ncbi:MAG: hypothetical protein ABJF88_11140 [Rhodothermales bacterium]
MNGTYPISSSTLPEGERSQLIEAAHDAIRRGNQAQVEFGYCLRSLKLGPPPLSESEFRRLMRIEFDRSGERGNQLIDLAELHAAFTEAGVEPLVAEGHARAVKSLESLELQVRVVMRGRELAAAEGKRLFARHLDAAVAEVLAGVEVDLDDAPGNTEEAREPVHARGGLHVVLPKDAAPGDAVPYLPGRVVAPWEGGAALPEPSRRGLARVDLDEAAELVWPVVGPDPWTTAVDWEAPAGPFAATLFPDRLGAPSEAPSPDGGGRARTVLVAPGVDLLHPALPEDVAQKVIGVAGADRHRLYVFLTAHPDRVALFAWPDNAAVCLEACDAASAKAAALAATPASGAHDGAPSGSAPHFVLLLRDCAEPVAPEALRPFAWVLLRGKRTKQAAYDSVLRALAANRLHVGREVRANLKGNPLVAPVLAEPRPERRAVAVVAVGDRAKGPLRPPARQQ